MNAQDANDNSDSLCLGNDTSTGECGIKLVTLKIFLYSDFGFKPFFQYSVLLKHIY